MLRSLWWRAPHSRTLATSRRSARQAPLNHALKRLVGPRQLEAWERLCKRPPVAIKKPESAVRFGHVLTDDYAYIMNMMGNRQAQRYLVQEDTYAMKYIEDHLRLMASMFSREIATMQAASPLPPLEEAVGPYRYYLKEAADPKRPAVYARRNVETDEEAVILDPGERLSASGRRPRAIATMKVSQDHQRLVFLVEGRSHRGGPSDASIYDAHVRSVAPEMPAGEEVIPNVVNVEWSGDARHLYYTVSDDKFRPYRVYRHALGRPLSEDVLVHEEADPQFFIDVGRTRDWRYLVVHSHSKTTSEVRVVRGDGEPQLIAARQTGTELFVDHVNDVFVIVTNDLDPAAHRICLAADADVGDLAKWREIVPPIRGSSVEDVDVFRKHIVIYHTNREGSNVTIVRPDEGDPAARIVDVPLPSKLVAIEPSSNLDPDAEIVRFTVSSPIDPGVVYDLHLATGALRVVHQIVLGTAEGARRAFDAADYVVERALVGEAPITIVRRRDMARTGDNLTLVQVYGAYGHNLSLEFDPMYAPLLQRGWVLVFSHCRGGGELGSTHHDRGRQLLKRNTFVDFRAALQHLVDAEITSPQFVVLRAASAGALAVGVAANEFPEAFKAAVLRVPFLDVLSTMLQPELPLTVHEYDEWGNPSAIQEDFEAIREYDPYWNIRKQHYPAMLITSALHDLRVPVWHHARYVAKVRTYKQDQNPLLIRLDSQNGHFGDGSQTEKIRDTALELAFIYHALNILPERI